MEKKAYLLAVVHLAPVAAAEGSDLRDLEVGVLGLGQGASGLVHPQHVGARGALLARRGGRDGVGVAGLLDLLELGGLCFPRLLEGGGHSAPDLAAERGDSGHLHLRVALLRVLATLLVHPQHVGGLRAALARLGGVHALLGALWEQQQQQQQQEKKNRQLQGNTKRRKSQHGVARTEEHPVPEEGAREVKPGREDEN